jgi:RNA polymerase sigma factor (sigma-70 family)
MDELPDDRYIDVGRVPLRGLLDDELSLKVKEAVSNLPPMQREALILFEYEGLALSEIAEMVGADVGAVKARLHRARQGLKGSLQAYLNSSPEIVTLEKA